MIQRRFFSISKKTFKMANILESYYQNGLNNYSSQENRKIIASIVQNHRNVFKDEEQVKRWINRRKAKDQTEPLLFPYVLADGKKQPQPLEVTSLKLPSWKHYLRDCLLEDKQWVLDGIAQGFSMNFDNTQLASADKNLASANIQPEIIDNYLQVELKNGTMFGPYENEPFKTCQINRFGVIPKSDGKFRMITDLSFPFGESVNDGISKANSTVSYIGLTKAIETILSIGEGCLLAKFDIQRAYRMMALKVDERNLVVIKWKGLYFVDLALPFGARSAPRIFTRFSDILEWIIKIHGSVTYIQHSLDDFLILGPPGSSQCLEGLERALCLCEELGVPIEQKKTVYPTTSLVFLGMQVDTESMELRVPAEKLERIRKLLDEWVLKKSGTKRSLLSLIGSLYFCCQAIVMGKPFVVRLGKRAYSVEKLHQTVFLGDKEVEDLMWWYYLLNSWNGRSFLSSFENQKHVVKLSS